MRIRKLAKVAWLVGLTTAVSVLLRGHAAAENDGISRPGQSRDWNEAVSTRVTDEESEGDDFLFAVMQPPVIDEPSRPTPRPATEPPPRRPPDEIRRRSPTERSPLAMLALYETRRRRRLATVPHMFGDFFGGGGGCAEITFPPMKIVVNDGPFDLFVTNAASGVGADVNPAVPILVSDGPAGALLVTSSIGNGLDISGDGQPDTYPVSSPSVPGALPPSLPCPGTWVYSGGNAVFADTQGNPSDGSVGEGNGWSLVANYVCEPSQVVVNVPYGGGAIRRFKIAEHSSPEPRDRLFFDFNFYNDAIGGVGDVSRYTFGFERTFLSGLGSIEVRMPFAGTLASEQTADGTEARDIEFGNLAVWMKTVLYEIPTGLISGGLGIAAPTGPTSRVLAGQTPILEIENDAVHLLPYLGAMSTPRERWFWQAFLQLDIDTNGNRVCGDVTGQNMTQFGVLQDATLLFVDAGVGYSIYEGDGALRGITRIAPTAELHYSTTLQDTDVAHGNGFLLRSPTQRFDVLNLTLGTSMLWCDRLWIRPAMAIPLREDGDKHFDYEAMVQVDWRL